jgi:hypothetical protein
MEKPPFQFGLKVIFALMAGTAGLMAVLSAESELDTAIAAVAVLTAFLSIVVLVFILPHKK